MQNLVYLVEQIALQNLYGHIMLDVKMPKVLAKWKAY
jgi:hypothetical protein